MFSRGSLQGVMEQPSTGREITIGKDKKRRMKPPPGYTDVSHRWVAKKTQEACMMKSTLEESGSIVQESEKNIYGWRYRPEQQFTKEVPGRVRRDMNEREG